MLIDKISVLEEAMDVLFDDFSKMLDCADIEKIEVKEMRNQMIDMKSWLAVDMKRVIEKTFALLK